MKNTLEISLVCFFWVSSLALNAREMNYKVPNTGNPLLPGDFMVPTKLMVNENYEEFLVFDVSQTESFIVVVADDRGIYSRFISKY